MALTEKQRLILQFCQEQGGEFKKKDLMKAGADSWYYYNAGKHVGDVIGRMINSGLLIRIKRGHYKAGKCDKGKKVEVDPNQYSLF